jgi:protocatechuate 3,4-dioxygenase beta subunit
MARESVGKDISMHKRWLAVLVLAVVASVAAFFFLRGGEPPVEQPGGVAPVAAETPAALPERANALLTAPLPPPKGDRVIRGRVLGLDGPVEGAVVVASTDGGEEVLSDLPCRCDNKCGQKLLECGCDGAAVQLVELVLERRGEAPPIARATSAADGSFTLSGLGEGAFALWAEKPGRLIGLRRGVAAGEEKADVEVTAGTTLRGKTVGDDGKPVAATVTAIYAKHSRFFDAVSLKDGAFVIGPVPVGDYSVVASAPGLLPSHGRATSGDPDLKDLKLHGPRRIAGTVTRDGAPVARATVTLEGAHKKAKAATDEKGRFEFGGLKPRTFVLVAAEGLAQARENVELKPGKDVLDVQLSLSRGGEIVGGTKTEAGAPVAEADVDAWGNRQRSSHRTEADGRFRLGPVPPGKYQVGVHAEGYLSPDSRQVEVAEGATVTVELVLKTASPLKGVVVDEEGRPVEDASVSARSPRPAGDDREDRERRSRHGAGSASSHHDGTFFVDGLAAGPYDVTVGHEQYVDARLTVTAPTTEVRVILSRGLEIVGTVVDEDDQPVAGVRVAAARDEERKGRADVRFQEEESSEKVQDATGARGDFRLRGLEAGRWLVSATQGGSRDFREAHARVEVRPGSPPSVRLKFEKGLAISGTVSRAGLPVPGVEVSAYPAGERKTRPSPDEIREMAGPGRATSAEDGTFVVKHLKPGAYQLSAVSEEGSLEEAVKANAGDADVKLVLEAAGKVRGRVVSAAGAPVTHFKIGYRDFRDEKGAFELPSGEPGEQKLVVQAEGFAEVTRKFEAKKGEDVDVGEIVLAAGRPVSGKVLDAQSGAPVADALVDVGDVEQLKEPGLRLAVEMGAVRSRADGTFTLPHVDARPLAIFASHPTHVFTGQPLPADVSDVIVRLERGASVVGAVTDGAGKPVAQVMIMAHSPQGSFRATTGEDGRYRLDAVPPGKLGVMVFSRTHANIPGRTVDVPATGEVQVDFVVPSGGVQVTLALAEDLYPMLLPGEVPLPAKEEDLRLLVASALHPLPAGEEEQGDGQARAFVVRNVVPGPYTLLLFQRTEGDVLKVARQPLPIAAEPAQQRIAVPLPGTFAEIKMTRRGR